MTPVGKLTFISLTFLVITLFGIKTQIENDLSIKGTEFAQILEQTYALKQQNETLHDDILTNESLTVIREKTVKRGFVQATYIYFH